MNFLHGRRQLYYFCRPTTICLCIYKKLLMSLLFIHFVSVIDYFLKSKKKRKRKNYEWTHLKIKRADEFNSIYFYFWFKFFKISLEWWKNVFISFNIFLKLVIQFFYARCNKNFRKIVLKMKVIYVLGQKYIFHCRDKLGILNLVTVLIKHI